jgi:hypothetical protein
VCSAPPPALEDWAREARASRRAPEGGAVDHGMVWCPSYPPSAPEALLRVVTWSTMLFKFGRLSFRRYLSPVQELLHEPPLHTTHLHAGGSEPPRRGCGAWQRWQMPPAGTPLTYDAWPGPRRAQRSSLQSPLSPVSRTVPSRPLPSSCLHFVIYCLRAVYADSPLLR